MASQPGIMIDNKSQISPEIELASQSEIDEIVLVKESRKSQTTTVIELAPQPDRKSQTGPVTELVSQLGHEREVETDGEKTSNKL